MTSSLRSQTALAAVLAALALTPSAALAAPDLQAEFNAMDADRDGYLTAAEFKRPGELTLPDTYTRLRQAAANGGSLTAEMTLPVNRLDDDQDQKVSFAEYRRGRIRGERFRFNQADLNSDGVVTRDEYVADLIQRATPLRYAAYTDVQKANHEKGLKIYLERETPRFAALDTDRDGVISRSEMIPVETLGTTAPAARPAITLHTEFAAMDADKDGYISAAELQIPTDGFGVLPLALKARPVAPDGVDLYAPDGTERKVRMPLPGRSEVAAEGEVLVTLAQLRQLLLNRYETNGDQRLDLGEYSVVRVRGAENRFNLIDADYDGRVTREEFMTGFIVPVSPQAYAAYTEVGRANYARNMEARRVWATERFALLDTNHDGVVTRGEMIPS